MGARWRSLWAAGLPIGARDDVVGALEMLGLRGAGAGAAEGSGPIRPSDSVTGAPGLP